MNVLYKYCGNCKHLTKGICQKQKLRKGQWSNSCDSIDLKENVKRDLEL